VGCSTEAKASERSGEIFERDGQVNEILSRSNMARLRSWVSVTVRRRFVSGHAFKASRTWSAWPGAAGAEAHSFSAVGGMAEAMP
jgi:hypothetical protein